MADFGIFRENERSEVRRRLLLHTVLIDTMIQVVRLIAELGGVELIDGTLSAPLDLVRAASPLICLLYTSDAADN